MTLKIKTRTSVLCLLALAGAVNGQLFEWSLATDGLWSNQANWSPMGVPDQPGESARIALAGAYTVSLDTNASIDGLELTNPDAILGIGNARVLSFVGTSVTNDGTIVVNTDGSTSTSFLQANSVNATIAGVGEIVLNGSLPNDAVVRGFNTGTLTIGAGQIVSGNGQIGPSVINEGLIDPAGADDILEITSTLTNNALVTATEGTLSIAGGTIVGGTVGASGAGFMGVTSSSATLDGVTNTGTLGTRGSGSLVIGAGGLVNAGTIVVNTDGSTDTSRLRADGLHTMIAGVGDIVLNGSSSNDAVIEGINGGTLTIGAGQTVRGTGEFGSGVINETTIDPGGDGESIWIRGVLTNNGVVTASVGELFLLGGSTVVGGGVGATGTGFMGVTSSSATLDGVTNTGTLGTRGTGALQIGAGGLVNDGTIVVNTDGSTSTSRLRADGLHTMIAGVGDIVLNGSLPNDAVIEGINGGTLTIGAGQSVSGRGQIGPGSTVEGTISPGNPNADITDTIEATGDLTLTQTSLLRIDIEGLANDQFDRLPGGGAWQLAGALMVQVHDGYNAEIGDLFRIIDAASVTGEFESTSFPPLGPNRVMRVVYFPDGVELRVTCSGDLNANFSLDGDDFFAFLDAFATRELNICDIDDDGDCDADDFFAFLDFFVIGCD